jgi:biopolymer transport protein ExbB/TolQ
VAATVTVFAWSALLVFTVTTAALLVLLGRALFHALDRVDRARDDVWTMAKTLDSISARLERIEVHLGAGDQRMEGFRDELRSTMRRDLREIVENSSTSRRP